MTGRRDPAAPPREAPPPPAKRPRSLVLLNTGDGKGKSTAAFGVVLRGLARDWKVCVVQFIKSDRWKVGEEAVARRLGVDWLQGGDGFTWESADLDSSAGRAAAAWELAAATIAAGEHQLVVLDEVTYPVTYGWIEVAAVVDAIRNRPAHVNLVLTGRNAAPELIEVADTVTEMVKVKHPYDRGIKARRGIDF
jgi:cob(I)alamin adenosyltransferase